MVNLDNFETLDTRPIIPGIGFSIEPGVYLPEFGGRSEIDAFMSEDSPYASSPVQREVVLIQSRTPAEANRREAFPSNA